MPHVSDKVLEKIKCQGYAENSGEFAAHIAVQCMEHLRLNGTGFKERAEVLAGLISCTDEWRKYVSSYEDQKAKENGNIFEKLEEAL